jgi:F0F1-type ATP synthase assembly protein I
MDFFNQQFNQFTGRPQEPKSIWQQSLRFRYGIVVGLIVGILIGWFFHGVVSLVVRLGFLALLLIPLIIIAWFFLKARNGGVTRSEGPSGSRIYTIGNAPEFMRGSRADAPPRSDTPESRGEPVIELNDDDYDLEQFKKRLEREN